MTLFIGTNTFKFIILFNYHVTIFQVLPFLEASCNSNFPLLSVLSSQFLFKEPLFNSSNSFLPCQRNLEYSLRFPWPSLPSNFFLLFHISSWYCKVPFSFYSLILRILSSFVVFQLCKIKFSTQYPAYSDFQRILFEF